MISNGGHGAGVSRRLTGENIMPSKRIFITAFAAACLALPAGAALINVGRGGHLVATDLLAALDRGHVSAAILDVTDPEPLPADHPFWCHPRVLLTPHVASSTDPAAAAHFVADAILRSRAGKPLPGLVDRLAGY